MRRTGAGISFRTRVKRCFFAVLHQKTQNDGSLAYTVADSAENTSVRVRPFPADCRFHSQPALSLQSSPSTRLSPRLKITINENRHPARSSKALTSHRTPKAFGRDADACRVGSSQLARGTRFNSRLPSSALAAYNRWDFSSTTPLRNNKPMTWEQRWHPLREEWVIVAAHRNDRPWTGHTVESPADEPPAYDSKCPLCPGNVRVSGGTQRGVHGRVCFRQRPTLRGAGRGETADLRAIGLPKPPRRRLGASGLLRSATQRDVGGVGS